MPFSHADFFKIAEHLMSSVPDNLLGIRESFLRTAISRFYYSAYGVGVQYARTRTQKGYFKDDGEDHRRLVEFFRDSQNDDEAVLVGPLTRMRAMRIDSDYRAHVKCNDRRVSDCKQDAEAFLDGIRRLAG